ncbi:Sec39-domain-containing protein [Artomyces pyxidatus]|uniref:Sec39-domain-containing protein n=1 Tax=Artomyces pyxidatus TaxID=48021 RepID=A0ACB8TIZ5_9AGAM|nr:Sec39-domain-containing protein [Artomyces pyxidatus]
MASSSEDLCEQWALIPDDALTPSSVQTILATVNDDLWVAAASVDRLLDDVDIQRALLELGLERSQPALDRARNIYPPQDAEDPPAAGSFVKGSLEPDETLVSYFRDEPADAQLCYIRSVLLGRLDRLNTFVEICRESVRKEETQEGEDDEWDDDPWEEGADEPVEKTTLGTPPVPLSTFLSDDLMQNAYCLATRQSFSALRVLYRRHGSQLWPFRFTILDTIPEHAHPSEFRDILPEFDPSDDMERHVVSEGWRPESDWSELASVRESLKRSEAVQFDFQIVPPPPGGVEASLSPTDLAAWYKQRAEHVMASTGMTDIALAVIQHGASQGLPGLDELGEELSLLSRLVYDAQGSERDHEDDDWTLDRWRAMDPPAIVRAYVAHTSPETIVQDVRKLVMPYLFVLEARAERTGNPDPSLATRLLRDYILSAPLDIVVSIFEASKPTLPAVQRLILDDEDMARIALACLYGSDSLHEWSTMGRIFECLPAWDTQATEDQADEADTTVSSLGAFVAPTTARPRVTPSDLIVFFQPLPATSLSRALDILDIHLESGEILSRWNVPAPLRWFLQSAHDEAQQRARATRMARRTGRSADELDGQGDWEWLLEDMLKLVGANDAGLKSAFGLLSQADVIRIFFGGLLSTGRFDIAKSMLRSKKHPLSLDDDTIEDICLSASREFYDNASSGNYRFGDMKLAYDCLTVPARSDKIIREQEFIEATSRIASFNVMSRPGIPISPIEIRLTKDRLSLVSRVLSSNSDAYKYTEVILDLVHKLGFRDDAAAQVKALAMIADTALQAEDFDRAYETSETMVKTVLELRSDAANIDDPQVTEASEVCWVACFQLGRQPEFSDVSRKLTLLGRALEFCPADKLVDILAAWRRLEADAIDERKGRPPKRRATSALRPRNADPALPPSLAARFQNLHMPDLHMPTSPLAKATDGAALASTFSRVAANFPFSVGGRSRSVASDDSGPGRSRSNERARPGRDGDVSEKASRAFQKGIGWLIGADEEA